MLAAAGMPATTPHTITDIDRMLEELAVVRAQGYAVDDGEQELGVRCVAVAVNPATAVSVSGPNSRVTHEAVPSLATVLQVGRPPARGPGGAVREPVFRFVESHGADLLASMRAFYGRSMRTRFPRDGRTSPSHGSEAAPWTRLRASRSPDRSTTASRRSSARRALELVGLLHRELGARREELLARRGERFRLLAEGGTLDFLEETRGIREDDSWRVAEPAPGLVDRRVEMTGPTDRKMTINALNSGAKVWLADQEDANTPLWENVVNGPLNLLDSLTGDLDFTSPEGKQYRLKCDDVDDLPTIVVRPRGWHLPEKHVLVDGQQTGGGLVDFALYLTACGQKQIDRGRGPYFYLAKMESHLEARLWNDAFNLAQDFLGIPRGTIRATVLIETYPAAFEMEEILYELRDHSAGLNAGRWDYMFSVIKSFRSRGREFLLPDRNSVTMTVPFMRAYTELLVRTCHKRGAHAIGGMAAFIPSKDPEVNDNAFREARRRQVPRGRRRLRRLVGGPPRHGRGVPRGVHQGAR